MSAAVTLIVLHLVKLTGPDGQLVEVNPQEIVSIRSPREGGVHPDVKCLLHTSDGKFIAVVETCTRVQELLEESDE